MSKIADIFNTLDEILLVFTEIFFFILFCLGELRKRAS